MGISVNGFAALTVVPGRAPMQERTARVATNPPPAPCSTLIKTLARVRADCRRSRDVASVDGLSEAIRQAEAGQYLFARSLLDDVLETRRAENEDADPFFVVP